jgi:hypothetical protein
MKRLTLTLALAAVAVSGCAHLSSDPAAYGGAAASGGASAAEEQRPYPKTFPNDHYYAP